MRYLLNKSELKTLNFILNTNENNQINEGLLDRIKEVTKKGKLTKNIVVNLIKKGAISAALLTTLLNSNPTFAQIYKSIPSEDKIEQVSSTDRDIFDVSKSFESGVWKIGDNGKQELTTQLEKVVDYINSLNGESVKFKITIIASESRLRNRDAETKEVLPEGELAKRRAVETKKFMTEFFSTYNQPNMIIDISTDIAGPKNTGQSKEAFTPYQFVKIKVTTVKVNTDNFCSFKDEVSSTDIKNNIGMEKEFNVEGEYGSGTVILTTGSIPDRVVIMADDKIIGDSGFFATSTNPYLLENWEYTPANVAELTKLYKLGSIATKTDLEIHKVNTFEDLMDLMLKKKSLIKQYSSLTSDKNEEDVAKPMRELIAMYKSGVRDFVFYKKEQVKVNFDLAGKYKKIKLIVYSPRNRSDFKIKVNCNKQLIKKVS